MGYSSQGKLRIVGFFSLFKGLNTYYSSVGRKSSKSARYLPCQITKFLTVPGNLAQISRVLLRTMEGFSLSTDLRISVFEFEI